MRRKPNYLPVNQAGLILGLDYKNSGSVSALGTWKDYSGKGNDATFYDSPFLDSTGINLDGSDHAIVSRSSDFELGSLFTMIYLISPTLTSYGKPFSCAGATNDGWDILDYDQKVYIGKGSGLLVNSINTIPRDDRTHVAITYDGTNVKVYLNSVLNSTTPITYSFDIPAGENLYIGKHRTTDEFFTGKLNGTQIYKGRVLSAGEIKQNYLKGA